MAYPRDLRESNNSRIKNVLWFIEFAYKKLAEKLKDFLKTREEGNY